MKKYAFIIFRFLNRLIPKNKNKYIFMSNPLYSGNCKYLYEYYIENKKGKNLIWISWEKKNLKSFNFKYYNFWSLKGLFHYLTAYIVLTTHNEGQSLKAKNQIYVDLWHGLPIKTIYSLIKGNEKNRYCTNVDYRIVTTSTTKKLLERAFNSPTTKHVIIGQPRNIILESKNEIEKISPVKYDKNTKKILYLPTFRQSKFFEYNGKFTWFADNNFNLKTFNKFLKENKITIFVKLHPAEEASLDLSKETLSNIIVFRTEDLIKKNVDLYNLLPEIDVLITDYSSVYYDFLIYDKPIIFTFGDIDEYRKERGFIYDDFENFVPGKVVKTQKELEEALITKDEFVEKRRKVKKEILGDCKNISERVAKFLETI